MPTNIFERGSSFLIGGTYGIVLDFGGNALLITMISQKRYRIEKKQVPVEATRAQSITMPLEVQMIFDTIKVLNGQTNMIDRDTESKISTMSK
jgi:hypothetical protein